jgi:AcrR family transcriptional regulator
MTETKSHAPKPDSPTTRGRIIKAAGQLFRDQGYARTTTRTIAAAAGITEITLFRHFGTKANLFSAVVETYTGGDSLAQAIESQDSGDFQQDMLQIGKLFMKVLQTRRDAIRLMLCESTHFPEVREITAQNPAMLRQPLANYLRREIKKGNIIDLDADVLAQSFLGMFFSYTIMDLILGNPIASVSDAADITSIFVSIFVNGTSIDKFT